MKILLALAALSLAFGATKQQFEALKRAAAVIIIISFAHSAKPVPIHYTNTHRAWANASIISQNQFVQVHRGGDVTRALELYNAVIADAPTYSDAYHLKVCTVSFCSKGRWGFVPTCVFATKLHTLQGVAYLDMGDRPTAQQLIRHAVKLNPQDPNFHNSLGNCP